MKEFYSRLIDAYGRLGPGVKIALVVGAMVVSTAIAMAVVVRLPADHFSPARVVPPVRLSPVRLLLLVLKNAFGLLLLPLGVVMALPLVPGPGLLVFLIGVGLLNFPGKRRIERRIIAVPAVRRALDDMRSGFGRPPLDLGDR